MIDLFPYIDRQSTFRRSDLITQNTQQKMGGYETKLMRNGRKDSSGTSSWRWETDWNRGGETVHSVNSRLPALCGNLLTPAGLSVNSSHSAHLLWQTFQTSPSLSLLTGLYLFRVMFGLHNSAVHELNIPVSPSSFVKQYCRSPPRAAREFTHHPFVQQHRAVILHLNPVVFQINDCTCILLDDIIITTVLKWLDYNKRFC